MSVDPGSEVCEDRHHTFLLSILYTANGAAALFFLSSIKITPRAAVLIYLIYVFNSRPGVNPLSDKWLKDENNVQGTVIHILVWRRTSH